MNDSLGRLVLRAQGLLPVAAPLLSSRYAEPASDGMWAETTAEAIAPTEAVAVASPARPLSQPLPPTRDVYAVEPSVRGSPAPPLASLPATLAPASVPGQAQPQMPIAPHRVAAIAMAALVRPTVDRTEPVAQSDPELAGGATSGPWLAKPSQGRHPDPPLRQAPDPSHPVLPVGSRPSPPQPALLMRDSPTAHSGAISAPAAPPVRISIGRVEIHAAATPTQPAPAARPTSSRRPTVSLADYLAERGRAR